MLGSPPEQVLIVCGIGHEAARGSELSGAVHRRRQTRTQRQSVDAIGVGRDRWIDDNIDGPPLSVSKAGPMSPACPISTGTASMPSVAVAALTSRISDRGPQSPAADLAGKLAQQIDSFAGNIGGLVG